eukprot:5568916-Amphidinium_carterae.1
MIKSDTAKKPCERQEQALVHQIDPTPHVRDWAFQTGTSTYSRQDKPLDISLRYSCTLDFSLQSPLPRCRSFFYPSWVSGLREGFVDLEITDNLSNTPKPFTLI